MIFSLKVALKRVSSTAITGLSGASKLWLSQGMHLTASSEIFVRTPRGEGRG